MRSASVSANPVQGLTCFHQYRDRKLKTLSIDMLYTSLDAFETRTTLALASRQAGSEKRGGSTGDIRRAYDFLGSLTDLPLAIESENDFDPDIGLGSSSSGFACIAGAASRLLGLPEQPTEVSRLARQGSFSAAAAVTGGISLVRSGGVGVPTFAERIFGPEELPDLSVVVAFSRYDKANRDFYAEANSSPIVDPIRDVCSDLAHTIIASIEARDIDRLAMLSERHSIMNYAVLHTGSSNLLLWQPETVTIMHLVRSLRTGDGLPVFYSMNTGANVFVYCFSDDARARVEAELAERGLPFRSSKVGGALRYLDEPPAIGSALAVPVHGGDGPASVHVS
ncbi:GHMP family kinase ATP-binding protein [Salinarimonas sp. NSM]|uniref:GHMP family kinase ATP-binding protein n=1 Tax=Salinarimonas sp. NSM TaxID=3458003 RepID=UPI0040353C23